MRFLLILALSVTACAPYQDPCLNADVVIDGVCVNLADAFAEVDPGEFSATLDAVQQALKWRSYRIDVRKFVAEWNIGVVIKPVDGDSLLAQTTVINGKTREIGGYQRGNILVVERTGPQTYHYIGHELLHAIIQYDMGKSGKENADHSTPHMFVQHAEAVDEDPEFTVEGMMDRLIIEYEWKAAGIE